MQVTFRGWQRPQIGEAITGLAGGRPLAEVTVRLTGRDAEGRGTGNESVRLAALLVGPADIEGLRPGAITRRFPSPQAPDAETPMCPYVEFADPALPWRYTPQVNPQTGVRALRPWLVLVVGTDNEVDAAGDQVTLSASLRAAFPLADSFRWAHVQEAGGVTLARVLSARPLVENTDYVAALVPGFAVTAGGTLTDAWPVPGPDDGPLTVAAYAHWRFRTGPGGDFRTLANRLRPGAASETTGVAPVAYPRVPTAAPMPVRGALAPIEGPPDAPLDRDVTAHLAGLRTSRKDEVGRPIVGLPRYGDAWHEAPGQHTWARVLNRDPRHRGVAGIGLRLGVEIQERLAAEANRQAGALDNAAQRVRHLSAGLAASAALWRRRLPVDANRRLWLFGPALRRVVTPAGSVDRLATAEDRPLAPGWFSTAARRATRPGPARSALAERGAVDPARLAPAANRPPTPAPFVEAGLPVFEDLDGVDAVEFERQRKALGSGAHPSREALTGALGDLEEGRFQQAVRDRIDTVRRLVNQRAADQPTPWVRVALALAALSAGEDDPAHDPVEADAILTQLIDDFEGSSDDDQIVCNLAIDLGDDEEPAPPSRPVDLVGLADELTAAFDPTAATAPARRRVLTAVTGLDEDEPLAPPEPCPGLDLPAWQELAAFAPDWLLPGVGQLDPDTVIALVTNPVFVDAFLVGLNTRALEEFRWRNVRVASGCTPLRGFWTRNDTAAGARIDDIIGIRSWTEESVLGDAQHRPADLPGGDLALVFRGQLFDRYPGTLLYLVTATHDGEVDFTIPPDPNAPRDLPTFQGRIGTDVRFFGFHGVDPEAVTRMWVVLEEPPGGGIRFRNDVRNADQARDGAEFAARTFDDPTRVLIQGDHVLPGGEQP
jgi:hypothetical protein